MARVPIRLAVLAGLASLVLSPLAAASAAPHARTRFSPDFGRENFLNSVQALSSHNAWAVGYFCKTDCADPRTQHDLILHWTGAHWARVASPNPGSGDVLNSVSAVSRSDIWAVGEYLGSPGDVPALVLHWNGSKWARVAFRGDKDVTLTAVSARSARDAWIVGYQSNPVTGGARALAARWNGRAWRQVPVPHPGPVDFLNGIAVKSATSAWAVGQYCAARCSTIAEVRKAMIMRWNGRKWARVRVPATDAYDLSSIDVVSANDAWAAGLAMPSRNKVTSLILHWNGKRWSTVPGVRGVIPQGLAFGARGDGWALAYAVSMRWNGVKWRKVVIPVPETTSFTAASATNTHDVWAVGLFCPPTRCGPSGPIDTLVMHWNGRKWVRT